MNGSNETRRIHNLQSAYSLRRWMLAQEETDPARRQRTDEHIAQIVRELRAAEAAAPAGRPPERPALNAR